MAAEKFYQPRSTLMKKDLLSAFARDGKCICSGIKICDFSGLNKEYRKRVK